MNKHSFGIRDMRASMYLCVLALAACSTGPDKEITSTMPYAALVGAHYSVVADKLYAYGVYESLNNKTVSYVLLAPRDINGPDYAFRRKISSGQTIRILSAWQHRVLFESGVYYVVEVKNSDLPQGVPIRLELTRGNESVGADLNPAVYRKLP